MEINVFILKDNFMALTKENSLKFLNELEGYHQAFKMVHWSTTNKAEHVLTDELDSCVLSFEDRIAENIMGRLGIRFGVGDLKSLLPNATDVSGLINELEEDVLSFRDAIDTRENSGIINILDDILENINKCKYLKTLK